MFQCTLWQELICYKVSRHKIDAVFTRHEALQDAGSLEALGFSQVSLGLHINDLQQYKAVLEWNPRLPLPQVPKLLIAKGTA